MADLQKFLDKAGVSTLWTQVAAEVAKVDAKATTNANDIAELKTKVQSLEEGTYDDTALRGLIAANAGAIEILNGTGNGSVTATATSIAAAKVAEIVAGADAKYDTLKEIADWIASDTTGAAEMANDIAALEGLVGDVAVATQISNAITAALKVEGVDKFALASELTALTTRVKALEDAGYQTKAQVDGAIAAYVTALNLANTYDVKGAAAQALVDAKAYTNAEIAKIQPLSEAEIQEAINSAKASN